MPAVTPARPDLVPEIADSTGAPRPVTKVARAAAGFEGAGFPVHRPFPGGLDLADTDPFLMLDEMGPVDYAPGRALGAPDHPHRGFETVTYLLDGEMEHRDSHGGGGVLRGGDTQWMTAGSGLVHSELPTAKMLHDGGRLHGVQLWVNLPRADKWAAPRYQDLRGDDLVLLRNHDGTALVRLIAGELAGHRGPGDTHTPIVYAHATLEPGARVALDWPRELNAIVYVLAGEARVGGDGGATVPATHAAALGAGDALVIEAPAGAAEPLEVLLLGGRPLREPVVSYGPFVMSTKQEIIETIEEYNRDPAGFGRVAGRG